MLQERAIVTVTVVILDGQRGLRQWFEKLLELSHLLPVVFERVLLVVALAADIEVNRILEADSAVNHVKGAVPPRTAVSDKSVYMVKVDSRCLSWKNDLHESVARA